MECLENRKENENTAARDANAPQPGPVQGLHRAWHIPKCTAAQPDSALFGGGGQLMTRRLSWDGSSEGCSRDGGGFSLPQK